jgi:toxin CcdB
MAQFDVYRNLDPANNAAFPYVLDIQSDLLSALATRVVAPLEAVAHDPPMKRLNPIFSIEGRSMMMATADIASVHRDVLRERVASLADHRYDVINAIDVLLTGI